MVRLSLSCPYCHTDLAQRSLVGSRCPQCASHIYIREQEDARWFLTKTQAMAWDDRWLPSTHSGRIRRSRLGRHAT